jgi:hypothetical protein
VVGIFLCGKQEMFLHTNNQSQWYHGKGETMKKFALFAMLLCAGLVGCAEKKAEPPKKEEPPVTKPADDTAKPAEIPAEQPK